MGGAIDKLELKTPGRSFWTRDLRKIADEAASESSYLLQRQGGHYRAVVDMRGYGLPAQLFLENRWTGSDKLVLVGAGEMSFQDILAIGHALFEPDARDLKIQRLDIAADVPGYPVPWCRDHAFVSRKRARGEIGKLCGNGLKRKVETLYFGARPNLIRIYDKKAELRARIRRLQKQGKPAAAARIAQDPAFQTDLCITRIERQFTAPKIPEQLTTLGSVWDHGRDFYPFGGLEFMSLPATNPIPKHIGASTYLKLNGFRDLINRLGYKGAVDALNQRTGGKAQRLIRRLSQKVGGFEQVVPPDLFALYREAFDRQLNGVADEELIAHETEI
jgi:hypothetical protein